MILRKCVSIECNNRALRHDCLCRNCIKERRIKGRVNKTITHDSGSLTIDFTGWTLRWELGRLWRDIKWYSRGCS